jgi:hypothetical protein
MAWRRGAGKVGPSKEPSFSQLSCSKQQCSQIGLVILLCPLGSKGSVMASASEAETGALFHNGQEAAHIRQILKELDREQSQPTRITTNNSTADGFANNRTKIKGSKAMDVHFYWIQDRVSQGQFTVHWQKGSDNLADYFTKHHPPAHHILMKPTYMHMSNLAHTIAPEWKGVLIQDPALDRLPVSAIQSYYVRVGQQYGYLPVTYLLRIPAPLQSSQRLVKVANS